jgi:hypothetical protein
VDDPVNRHLVSYPLTKREERTVGLIQRLTPMDRDHAIEFARLYAWEIGRAAGGAEGLLRSQFPGFLRRG